MRKIFVVVLTIMAIVTLLAPMAAMAASPTWYVQAVTLDTNGSLEPSALSFDRENCGWSGGVLTCGWIDGSPKTVTTVFGQGWGHSPTLSKYRFNLLDSEMEIVDFEAPAWMRARISEDGQALELDFLSSATIGKLPVKSGQLVFPMVSLTVIYRPSY